MLIDIIKIKFSGLNKMYGKIEMDFLCLQEIPYILCTNF